MVLITGATSGIGYALAELFAGKGQGLILVSSGGQRLNQTKEYLEAKYQIPVYRYAQDLAEPGAAENLYHRIKKDHLSVSVLINNAGFGAVGSAETIDIELDQRMLGVNVMNLVSLCKLFLEDMYRKGKGKILNVASTGAFQPGPYTATYFASKAYVLSFSKAIRYEAGARGVQVCTLCPGTTRTAFFERVGKTTPVYAMPPRKVAKAAYRGLIRNQAVIVPGIRNKLLRLIPERIRTAGIAVIKTHRF